MAGKPVRAPNKRRMAFFRLQYILNYYPIADNEARAIAQVTQSTWRRYKAGTAYPSPAMVDLIELHAKGKVIPNTKEWEGVFFNHYEQKLYDDYGHGHTLGDLRSFKLFRQMANQLQHLLKNYHTVRKPDMNIKKSLTEARPIEKIHAVK